MSRPRIRQLLTSKWFNRLLKLAITLLLLWVIYYQIESKTGLIEDWNDYLHTHLLEKWLLLCLAIGLLPVNYGLESMKWYILVNHFQKQSYRLAFQGVLTGITAGMITPARLGDYVGKLMFIRPENNWKAVWANFTSSVAQNLVTVMVGIPGLIWLAGRWLADEWPGLPVLNGNALIITSILLAIILFILYHNLNFLVRIAKYLPDFSFFTQIKRSLSVVLKFERNRLNLVLLFALSRYLVFLLQYLLILVYWGIDFQWILPVALSVVYLIQTVIPFPPLMSLLVRGEVALLILGAVTNNELLILFAALNIWIINLLIPAISGLVFIYRTDIVKSFGFK